MTAFKNMIGLDAKVGIFLVKTIAGFIFVINGNSKDTEVDLIEFSLQLSVIESKI